MKQFRGLAHIAVLTKDLERTVAFYETLGGTCTARDSVQKPTGVNQLAMIDMGGFWLEIVQPGNGIVSAEGGAIPHFAIEVENLEECAAELKAMGMDTFLTDAPAVLPNLFGGLKNWFFTGINGEQIELIEHFA